MGWVYARTRSVIPAFLLHSSMNASFTYSPMLPDKTDSLWPFIGLTVIIWGIVIVLVALNKMGRVDDFADESSG